MTGRDLYNEVMKDLSALERTDGFSVWDVMKLTLIHLKKNKLIDIEGISL